MTPTRTEAPAKRRRQHQEQKPRARTVALLEQARQDVADQEQATAKAKAVRDRLIVRRYREGGTFRQIAAESGVSRPRVEQIVRAAGAINGHQ